MNIQCRDSCLLDNQSSLENLIEFKKFPIFMGCVDTSISEDIFFDQVWGVSDNGLIQLKNLIDPNLLYKNSHTPGSVGETWKKHHKKFFNFIKENSDDIEEYLEIGGASGSLWNNFSLSDEDFKYHIIEPSDQKSSDTRLNYIKGFYEEQKFDKKYKCIIHSHVFEHVYNPLEFLKKISKDLQSDGIQFISIPNMRYWLSKGYTNTINFEHTFYVDEFVIEHLLQSTGFCISKKIVDEHSIFIKAIKSESDNIIDFNFSYIKPLFLKYINLLDSDVKEVSKKIKDKNVYLFGAHVFSQTLLNFGLEENSIISILDNDLKKQGKRLYGTNIFIESPKILKDVDHPIVILRSGIYNTEIENQLRSINPTVKII